MKQAPLDNHADVLVIGAGIVGLATGLALQMEGRHVVLLDPNEPASGCSGGNAGHLTLNRFSSIAPPDVLWRLPKMLMDPLGPLVIRPSYLLKLLPWSIRLLSSLKPGALARTTCGLTALNSLAMDCYKPLLRESSSTDLIETRGSIFAYRSREALSRGIAEIPCFRSHGVMVEELDPRAMRDLEPALHPDMAGGLLFPECGRCADPQELGKRFAAAITQNGGSLIRAAARSLTPTADGWSVQTGSGAITATQVVVSAGRWSDALLKPLGYQVPLEAERGYHLMLPEAGVSLTRPVAMVERSFIATPMLGGLRLAGTVEFAALDAPMDPRRADILYDLAVSCLPGLNNDGATRWMGLRPALPDSLPAIGRASRHGGLFYNFGHHHLGLTYAAVSAQILASVMAERTMAIEARQFSLDRFARHTA